MFAERDAIAMIAVKDLGRARQFYEGTLGLKPAAPSDAEVQTYKSGNTPIAVYVSQFAGTNKATAISWQLDDVDRTVRDLKGKGVAFEHYDMPETRREGDIHIAGSMRMAWFKDPDGNIIGLMSGMEAGHVQRAGSASSQ
jgi:catechol 2,3-dioxygenase-like lactoylglutathione lyase family enzyme